ncbi:MULTISPECIES: hypothetical protein [Olivibacter]|uniref:Uncharacterized protein n=1 Tax=Olivibacter oleidegradans TaxID=760123 RepID=A0ABV6HKJ2_9SPHI|nr:hypothetical protein [Olivibacter jilunii]
MKKLSLKPKILLTAFILGGSIAGATEIAQRITSSQQQTLSWQKYDRETQQPVGSPFNDTEANVREDLGCNDETESICATGTAPGVSTTIYYNEEE